METHCFDVLAVFNVSCIILRWLQLSLAESITSKETLGIRWLLWQHAFSVFVDAIGTVESWFLGETLEKFHNAYKALGKTTVTDALLDAIGRVHEQLISFDSVVCNNIDLSFAPFTDMSVKR